MRVELKQKLQEIMQTLYDALCYLDNQKNAVNNNLFEDCLICIETIKKSLEDEPELFTALCEKCQYKIRQKDYKEAIEFLEELWIKVDTKIKGMYEIVFLPYKADMWDSFDSIWREASRCELCQVSVVPIPYFNRSVDAGILKYEGNRFPADIPITDYKTYSLSARRPDVIFIHNPYDQYNTVTCVHPDYFSGQLIKYTNKLVYIPYFVVGNDIETEISSQYNLPAIQRSWRTFVQSNDVKLAYLKNPNLKSNQVLAMGSPKFDYVIRMNADNTRIPIQWAEKIKGRKVFLLNTHLNNILNAAKELPDRLRFIYSVFEKHSEAVLLWRPHPLSIETMVSMASGLLEEYQKLVEQFKSLPNVIYDDSSDLHRALAVSDAYIGDFSSLVTLYSITGKPMLVLKPLNRKNKLTNPLTTVAGAIKNGFLYFSAWHNGLFRLNLITEKIEFISVFSTETRYHHGLHSEAHIQGNYCWFIPQQGEYITKVDLNTYQMYKIEIPMMDKDLEIKFFKSLVKDGYLWLIPCHTDCLVRINMETDEVCRFSDLPHDIEFINNRLNCTGGIFAGESLIFNAEIGQSLLSMNPLKETISTEFCYKHLGTLEDLCFDGEYIWSYVKNSRYLYGWNISTGQTRQINLNLPVPESEIAGKLLFYSIYYKSGAIWLFPWESSILIKICPETEEIQHINLMDEYTEIVVAGIGFLVQKVISEGDFLFCTCANTNQIIRIHTSTNEIKRFQLTLTDTLKEQWWEQRIRTNKFEFQQEFLSDDMCTVEGFVRYIDKLTDIWNSTNKIWCNAENLDGTSGRKIWDYIFNELIQD